MTLAMPQQASQQPGLESQKSYSVLSHISDDVKKKNRYARAAKSICAEIAALSKSMMNETDLEVIEHVCSDGGAFKLGRACKCFPLIGSQKSFITQGEYRSATQALEKKFNLDLMGCRLGNWVYTHRWNGERLLFILRCEDVLSFFFFFLKLGD